MVRSLATAKIDLGPLLERLHDRISGAIKEFVETYKDLRHKLTSRSVASIIHDLMKWHMEQAFPKGNRDGVVCVLKRSKLFVLMVNDEYQIKIKKLDPSFRTFNVMTQATFKFLENGSQLELMPSPTNLHLGYLPRKAELATSEIWLTCPDGDKRPHWTMQIVPPGGGQVIPFREEQPHRETKPRVRPRKKEETADGNRKDESEKKKQ
jgi:hypothetical protein